MIELSVRVGDVWVNPRGRAHRVLRFFVDDPWKCVVWNVTFKKEEFCIWPIMAERWQMIERGDGEGREVQENATLPSCIPSSKVSSE